MASQHSISHTVNMSSMSSINDPYRFRNDFHTGYESQFQPDVFQSQKSSPDPLRYVQLKWWCWELVAAGISLTLLIAIVAVLRIFDGRALPELSGNITLNTTISLMATISKTAILVVMAATMSQFKWLWLHKGSKKLRDLQIFDEASRGPWGAITLLPHSGISVASFGALVIILLLGFDPFIQQLITTPHRDVSTVASSAMNKASTFNQSAVLATYNEVNNTFARLAYANPVNSLLAAVTNGANDLGELTAFTPSCPTANCKWPSFRSMGLCSTCVDVTDYARKTWKCEDSSPTAINGIPGYSGMTGVNRTCTYNLPNSNFSYVYSIYRDTNYTEVDGEIRLNVWPTSMTQSTFSDNIFAVISSMTFANSGKLIPGIEREQVQQATECSLAMCVQEHELSIDSGITKHAVKSAEQPFVMTVNPDFYNHLYLDSYDITPVEIDGVAYSFDGLLTLPYLYNQIMNTFFVDITADYVNRTKSSGVLSLDGGLTSSAALATSFNGGLNFNQSISNMATSVSHYMRTLSNERTTGMAYNTEVYIHVKWEWLAFPSFLILSGIVLLVSAIAQTNMNGLEVWKSSSLPLWFHGSAGGSYSSNLTSRLGGPLLERVNTLMEMEAEASQVRVTLDRDVYGSNVWMLRPTLDDLKLGYISR